MLFHIKPAGRVKPSILASHVHRLLVEVAVEGVEPRPLMTIITMMTIMIVAIVRNMISILILMLTLMLMSTLMLIVTIVEPRPSPPLCPPA